MIVVSNTSPLTNLAAIGQFGLLPRLYPELHIAHGVWEELNAKGRRWPGSEQVAKADWIEQHAHLKDGNGYRQVRRNGHTCMTCPARRTTPSVFPAAAGHVKYCA